MYDVKFDKNGLVPAIAVDAVTNEVLMQAYMNEEALAKTLESGEAYYWSRSRGKLWHKGEESGHIQKVVAVYADCDRDSILLKVEQVGGAACHTGARSCFFNEIKTFGDAPGSVSVLRVLDDTIKNRAAQPQEGSYTNYLLNKGTEKICKKVGEEATEAVIAAMKQDNDELAGEMADLLYHLFVLMQSRGINYAEVLKVLESRHACGADTPAREAKPKKNSKTEEI